MGLCVQMPLGSQKKIRSKPYPDDESPQQLRLIN